MIRMLARAAWLILAVTFGVANVAVAAGGKTSTSIVLSPSPSTVGTAQPVSLNYTLSPSGANQAGATITFKEGSTVLATRVLDGNLAPPPVVTFSTAGSHGLTAVYSGNANYAASTSAVAVVTVTSKAASATSLSLPSGAAYVGTSVPLTATVTGSGAMPTGTVNFYRDGTLLSTAPLNGFGVAGASWTPAATGSSTLSATYQGDAVYNPSTGSAVATVVVETATVLTATPTTVDQNKALTLQANVFNPGPSGSFPPNGTVTFKDGATVLGSAPTGGIGATIVTALSTTGTHSLTASFAGDSQNGPSVSAPVSVTVNAAPTRVLLSAPATGSIGQPVTLVANFDAFDPTGTVVFKANGSALGSALVSAARATLSHTFTSTGARTITAEYSGDAKHNAAVSDPATLDVQLRVPTVSLSASKLHLSGSGSVTLTATVDGYQPTGSVSFVADGTPVQSAPLANGKATIELTLGSAGARSLVAAYAGDANNAAASSSPVTLHVLGTPGQSPGNMTWLYGYEPNGALAIEVDPKGRETTRSIDAFGRETKRFQTGPGATPYAVTVTTHDLADQVTGVTDPRSLTTGYTVDGLGNVREVRSPDAGKTTRTFDAAGNVTSATDARGKATTYTYDALQRLKTVSYPTGTGTTFEYDGGSAPAPYSAGRLTKVTDESGSTSFTFDALGRVLTRTQVSSGKTLGTAYTYGAAGPPANKVTSITYPSGARVNYVYGADTRLTAVTLNPVNANGVGTNTASTVPLLSGITYTAGQVSGWTWADGTPYRMTFDSLLRPSSYLLGKENGSGAAAGLLRTLSYDHDGTIVAYGHTRAGTAQPAFNQAFAFDALGRLISHSSGTAFYNYAYDLNGNRTTRMVGPADYPVVIAADSNRVVSEQGSSGLRPYTHDGAGNVLSDGVASYGYSDRGRMASATVGANVVAYAYNGFEQRVRKTGPSTLVPTGTTYYAYAETGRLIGEYDANLVPRYETVRIGTLPVGVIKQARTGSGKSLVVATQLSFAYSDHLETPRVIVRNTDHAIQWRWDTAEAFGATPPNDNPNGFGAYLYNERFPGQVFDAETGLANNWHRDYWAGGGRYRQADRLGLDGGSASLYPYVGGNPLSRIDPTGEIAIADDLVIGGTVLAVGCAITPACRQAVSDAISGIGNLIFAKPYVNDPQAQAEHDEYKRRYKEPPPPFRDPCNELQWRLKREENLLRARQAWDAKWLPGRHAGMNGEIQSQNAIRKLKEKLKQQGCDCP